MKANDLRELILSIVKGEKNDATQREQNLSASAIKEMISSSADLTDAFIGNEEIFVAAKEVDGELHVLSSDSRAFVPFDSVDGEPKISNDQYYLNEEIDRLGEDYARVVTASEALAHEPSLNMKP